MTQNKAREKKKTVMFVCTGNTCRSAMAEYILRAELKKSRLSQKYAVTSSGVAAYSGDDMPNAAKAALKTLGVAFKKHKSKPTTPENIKKSDLIIAMTARHKEIVNSPKCVTLGSLIGKDDLPDPYGGIEELYIKTAECILYAAPEIISLLEKGIN